MAGSIQRGSRPRSRPFYATVLVLSALTAYSLFLHGSPPRSHSTTAALVSRGSNAEPECADVRTASDQCAFVHQFCRDDDAGLIPYLKIYYCYAAGSAQPFAFAGLVLWLGLLFTTIGIAASDFFSINLSTISTLLGLSESLAGVTFLAFGNGSPDLFSTFAAMGSNSASMAVGELIGAASFITCVVAGSMALVREFHVDRSTYTRDICFFIVAVCFTAFFLADGHLRFWECWIMVGYYGTYVTTVVGWHWYTNKRSKMLRAEIDARSHFTGAFDPSSADLLPEEPYHDDPENVLPAPPLNTHRRSRSTPFGTTTTLLDAASTEAGPRIEVESPGHPPKAKGEDEGAGEDHDRMVAAEVASSMRVLRNRGRRGHTMTPIRPSLVGALEFRSALAQLQRDGNHQLDPIPDRTSSEHDGHGRSRRGTTSVVTPSARSDGHIIIGEPYPPNTRDRALSSGDSPVGTLPHHPDLLIPGRPRSDTNLSLPPSTGSGVRTPSPSPSYTIGGSLAPPPVGQTGTIEDPQHAAAQNAPPPKTPQLLLQIPSRRSSYSDPSQPNSPFPMYTDSPAPITPASHHEPTEYVLPGQATRDSPYLDLQLPTTPPSPVRWWPYKVLPAPHVLLATFFPTLQGWHEKTYWDMFVSAISVPSVFLLVVTLPVVESETTDDDGSGPGPGIPVNPVSQNVAPAVSVEPSAMEPENEWERYRRRSLVRRNSYMSSLSSSRVSVVSPRLAPVGHDGGINGLVAPQLTLGPPAVATKPVSDLHSAESSKPDNTGWNRWLVALQLFTGPQFAMFILWANISEDLESPGLVLVQMALYTLLGSTVLFAGLLLFTSEDRVPRYHYLLCFMGFIISIAWISTVAGEVVGVLKTVGVILGISEALLGLTIFAAGNSIGDLVADITVARLGYPVMALSACFGGPMLNILLGIGIGGATMMIKNANHQHKTHPDLPMTYGPYEVQVGGTLMISTVTLLVTLAGLLIAVPVNKWVLSRRIGWGLIALWTVSTTANVVIELTGEWGKQGLTTDGRI